MNPNQLTPQELAQVAKIRAGRFGNPEGFVSSGLDKDVKNVNELLGIDKETKTKEQIAKAVLDNHVNNLQTDWNSFKLQDLEGAFGEGLQDALDSVGIAIDVIRPVITIIRTALEVLLAGADLAIDLLSDAFGAAILLLEAIVDLFMSTGVHELHYIPKNRKMIKTTREVLSIVASSYDDEFDQHRPISRSLSDTHLFVGILPAFADWSKLVDALKALAKLFDFSADHLKVKDFKPEDYPDNLYKHGMGAYPDWSSLSFADIKFVSVVARGINTLIAGLRTADKKTQVYRGLLKSIEERLKTIEGQINIILDLIESLINLSLLPINTLTVFGAGDLDAVKTAISSASYLETYPLKVEGRSGGFSPPEADMCAALCFHFTLGTGRALDFVRALFAIKEKAEPRFEEDVLPTVDNLQDSVKDLGLRYKDSRDQFKVVWNVPTSGQAPEGEE